MSCTSYSQASAIKHILHPLILSGETSLCVHSSRRPLEVLLPHKNGRYSDFLSQSLWMDPVNKKHGLVLALQSMRTSQVLIIVFIYKCHFIMFVRYNTLCSLLPSSLATSSPSATQNSESSLHFYHHRIQGDNS